MVGSLFTAPSIPTWYAALNKPAFNPPSWLFAPAWITLYTLMGVALFLVWRRGWEEQAVRSAVGVFALQLLLNAAWSPLFFGLHWLLPALVEIVLLWILILLTMLRFRRLSPPAGWLLLPYLAWVSFAAVLNFSLWWLNR
jgi:tryptophan-rich sensory protein